MRHRLPHIDREIEVVYERLFEDRPTIVFLHDSLGCICTWRDFPEQLAQKVNCNYLVYDRRGYGSSDADPLALKRGHDYMHKEAKILLTLIEYFKLKKPILFGHSDGATIALLTASMSSEIHTVIAEAGHIFVERITLDGILAAKQAYQTTNLKERLTKYHGDKTETVFRAWTETWLREDFAHWNIETELKTITCPCLVIQGALDEYGSMQQVIGIQNGTSGNVNVAIIEGSGHTPHKEATELTFDTTIDFLKPLI